MEEESKKSVLKQIRGHLRDKGFDTFYPSQHKGECLKPYVVIKYDGASQVAGISSDQAIYTLMCYVPSEQYSTLMSYVEQVKEAMKELFPLVRPNGNETSSIYEDDNKSHMVSVQYTNYRKINYWK